MCVYLIVAIRWLSREFWNFHSVWQLECLSIKSHLSWRCDLGCCCAFPYPVEFIQCPRCRSRSLTQVKSWLVAEIIKKILKISIEWIDRWKRGGGVVLLLLLWGDREYNFNTVQSKVILLCVINCANIHDHSRLVFILAWRGRKIDAIVVVAVFRPLGLLCNLITYSWPLGGSLRQWIIFQFQQQRARERDNQSAPKKDHSNLSSCVSFNCDTILDLDCVTFPWKVIDL